MESRYFWNSNLNEARLQEVYINKYDKHNNIIESQLSEFETYLDTIAPKHRNYYSYNDQYLLDSIAYYFWDNSIGKWLFKTKEEFEYNSLNMISKKITYEWDTTNKKLQYFSKTEYTYDSNKNLTLILTDIYDAANQKYYTDEKNEYTFNNAGKLLTENLYKFFHPSEKLVNIYKKINDYDTKNNLISEKIFEGDVTSVNLYENKHDEYSYDEFNNLKEHINYKMNPVGELLPIRKIEYTYNTTNTSNEILLPKADFYLNLINDKFSHQLINVNVSFYNNNNWANSNFIYFFYSENASSIQNNIENNNSILYPNPAKNYFQIKDLDIDYPAVIEIIDYKGRLIKTTIIEPNELINIQNLSAGQYFYNIRSGNKITTGNFVKSE